MPQDLGSNNTNKLSPQELQFVYKLYVRSSNNTNKLSPQELARFANLTELVQIIQINLVLKNKPKLYNLLDLFK